MSGLSALDRIIANNKLAADSLEAMKREVSWRFPLLLTENNFKVIFSSRA